MWPCPLSFRIFYLFLSTILYQYLLSMVSMSNHPIGSFTPNKSSTQSPSFSLHKKIDVKDKERSRLKSIVRRSIVVASSASPQKPIKGKSAQTTKMALKLMHNRL